MEIVTQLQTEKADSRRVRKVLTISQREARWGFFFISPWLIGFTIFYIFPMIASLFFTTLDFELATPQDARYIGLDNWVRMFKDPNTLQSLLVTFRFAALSLPIGIISPIMLALLLNSKHLMGRNLFRTLFYMPTMVPMLAGIIIWSAVLNPYTGWVNRFIDLFGIQATGIHGLRWFDEPSLVYIGYTIMGIWGIGNAVLINLASLQGIPTELFEAARIDGAGWFTTLRQITLPMISPVVFYNLVLGMIGLLQFFLIPYVMNGGSGYPEGVTNFYMVNFYKQAFGFAHMGYGATLAWLMFIVALVLTLILFGTSKLWVYYAGESK
jgi:ABC-type sugar transport system permease subunit